MKNDIRQLQCVNPELGERLFPYGLGTLAAEDAAAFEDHLMECAYCRTELAAGFEAFAALKEHRSDLVEQMKASGEDYDTLFAKLREAAEPERRRAISLPTRWKQFIDAVLNPWVYGPVVTAAVAVILILHTTRPPQLGTPSAPRTHSGDTHQLRALEEAKPESQPSQPQAEEKTIERIAPPVPETAPLADQVMPQQRSLSPDVAKQAVPALPEPRAMRAGHSTSELRSEVRVLPPQSVSAPPESAVPQQDITYQSPPVKIDVSSKQMRFAAGQSHETPLPPAVQNRALALIANPPLMQERAASTSMQQMLSKQPGFKVDPSGEKHVRKSHESAAPDTARPHPVLAGMAAYRHGDYAAAIPAFAEAAREQPADSSVWFNLGISHLQLSQWAAAAQALTKADSLSGSRNPLPHYYLALATLLNGDLETGRLLLKGLSARQDSLGIRAAELERLLDAPVKRR
ncbi:MAG TPA: tetratricopeptide repeat protein [bacterium]|jgi:hypothetical protein